MQDAPKAVWSIPYVSVASFFPSLKQNFITYRSSKVSSRPDCIFETHQLWQSDFSRVYSNFYCSCSFEPEIIKINQLSHKMYSNNILNFEESTTILNACKKSLETYWRHHVYDWVASSLLQILQFFMIFLLILWLCRTSWTFWDWLLSSFTGPYYMPFKGNDFSSRFAVFEDVLINIS